MPNVLIATSEDFETQTLSNGEERSISRPLRPLDKRFDDVVLDPRVKPVLEYDGVKVLHRSENGFPNATFSHYVVGKALREQGVQPERIVDLGSGVGFIGNYAAKKLGTPEVIFSDLNGNALIQSLEAWLMNQELKPHDVSIRGNNSVMEFSSGDGRSAATILGESQKAIPPLGLKADVATCAPMFVPGVCEVFPQAYEFFAGVAKQMGADLYVGHSNLAGSVVATAARRAGLRREEIFTQRVPLQFEYTDGRIHTAIQKDTESLFRDVETYLKGEGLEVNEHDSDRPRYCHNIVVSKLSGSGRVGVELD